MSQISEKFSLVLGEGKEDLAVMRKIANAAQISGLEYKEYGGKNNLKSFLKMESKTSNYTKKNASRSGQSLHKAQQWAASVYHSPKLSPDFQLIGAMQHSQRSKIY